VISAEECCPRGVGAGHFVDRSLGSPPKIPRKLAPSARFRNAIPELCMKELLG
jgi:hypothetical protein